MASQTNKNDDNKDEYKMPNIGDYQMKRNKNYFELSGDCKDDILDSVCARGYGLIYGAAIGDGIALKSPSILSMYCDDLGPVSQVSQYVLELASNLCTILIREPRSPIHSVIDKISLQTKIKDKSPCKPDVMMMRCIPFILYGSNLSDNDFCLLLQMMYTNSSDNDDVIFETHACYGIMAKYLLTCPENQCNRHINAIIRMIHWLKHNESHNAEHILTMWFKYDDNINNKKKKNNGKGAIAYHKNKNKNKNKKKKKCPIRQWLQSPDTLALWLDVIDKEKQNNSKIALLLCCFHLLQNNSYYDAILSVMKQRGDKATNAAIVGGMTGVLNGVYNLNSLYIKKIQVKEYYEKRIIQKLLKYAPAAIICERATISKMNVQPIQTQNQNAPELEKPNTGDVTMAKNDVVQNW